MKPQGHERKHLKLLEGHRPPVKIPGSNPVLRSAAAMRPSAQTGASVASRSSSTSNAFWNPYNHPSETSSRSSCEGDEFSRTYLPAEEVRQLEDPGAEEPPPGGFLCPDGGYFSGHLPDNSEDEEVEEPLDKGLQQNPYPKVEDKLGREGLGARIKDVGVQHSQPPRNPGGNPGEVSPPMPAMPCTPGRVSGMSREKRSRTWQKPLPPGAVKPDESNDASAAFQSGR